MPDKELEGRDRAGVLIGQFDVSLTDSTVIRLSQKVFGMDEVLDLRLWGRSKTGNLYPRKGQGLCMKTKNWIPALKLFTDNHLVRVEDSTVPITNS